MISLKIATFLTRVFRYSGILWLLNRIIPKKDKYILYISVPDFSDNPRHLFHFQQKTRKDHHFFWWIFDYKTYQRLENEYKDNPNVTFLYPRTFKAYRAYLSCRYIVISHTLPGYISKLGKSKSQKIINLWHGMPLKTIGIPEKGISREQLREYKYLGKKADFFVNSGYFRAMFSLCFGAGESQIHITGQPRSDMLINQESKDYHFPELPDPPPSQGKIILFLPTYIKKNRPKDEKNREFHPFYMTGGDTKKLNDYCNEKDWHIIVKPHGVDIKNFDSFNSLSNIHYIINPDVGVYPDVLSRIMMKSDLLVTDYSSAYVDFMILKKPVIFFQRQEQKYQDERGLLIGNCTKVLMPGEKVHSMEELKKSLERCLSSGKSDYSQEGLMLLHEHIDSDNSYRIDQYFS